MLFRSMSRFRYTLVTEYVKVYGYPGYGVCHGIRRVDVLSLEKVADCGADVAKERSQGRKE